MAISGTGNSGRRYRDSDTIKITSPPRPLKAPGSPDQPADGHLHRQHCRATVGGTTPYLYADTALHDTVTYSSDFLTSSTGRFRKT